MISRLSVAALLSMLAISLFSTPASAAGDTVRTLSVNDPAPLVVPANASAIIVFTVTLNGPALVTGERVTAMANADYCGTGVSHLTRWGDYSSMNLTFVAGGPRAQYVTVPLHQDPVYDGEVFSMKLSNPVGAVIAKAVGVGTVVDSPALFDDPFFFDACLSKLRWASN